MFRAAWLQFSCLRKADIAFQTRNHGHVFRRQPINVIAPGESEPSSNLVEAVDFDVDDPNNVAYDLGSPSGKPEKRAFDLRRQGTIKSTDGYNYVQLNDKNLSMFVSQMTQLKSKKSKIRYKDIGRIIIEGKRLIMDALDAGVELESMFFSKTENLKGIPIPKVDSPDPILFKLPYNQIQIWSDVTTSQGVIAIFKKPKPMAPNPEGCHIPLTIICDNLRDPGNLGAVLRCSAAVGCEKILLPKGCVDVWESKVLRTASGAHFRVPIVENIDWPTIKNYFPSDSKIILADNNTFSSSSHLDKSDGEPDPQLLEGDPVGTVVLDSEGQKLSYDEQYKWSNVKRTKKIKEVKAYTDVAYADSKHIVLVIGGETEGLSPFAHRLAKDLGGERVNVEMFNNVDSLNVGTAFGVIAFEIRRQFSSKIAN